MMDFIQSLFGGGLNLDNHVEQQQHNEANSPHHERHLAGPYNLSDLLVAHIAFAFLAWQVMAPIGILIAILPRYGIVLTNRFMKHWIWLTLAIIFNIICFVLGYYTQKKHFTSDHARLALAMMIMPFFQFLFGAIRPRKLNYNERVNATPIIRYIRPACQWFHYVLGHVLLLLAIITNCYGMIKLEQDAKGTDNMYLIPSMAGTDIAGFDGSLGSAIVFFGIFACLVVYGGELWLLAFPYMMKGVKAIILEEDVPSDSLNKHVSSKAGSAIPGKGSMAEFTLDEVAQHNREDSCWVIHSGGVYDVTKFLNAHPGGKRKIIQLAGKDMTDAYENVGHSSGAALTLKKYLKGRIAASDAGIVPVSNVPSDHYDVSAITVRRTIRESIRESWRQAREMYSGSLPSVPPPPGFGSFRSNATLQSNGSQMLMNTPNAGMSPAPTYIRAPVFLSGDQPRKMVQLVDRRQISPNTFLFVFQLMDSRPGTMLGLPVGKHLTMFAPNVWHSNGLWNGQPDPEIGEKEIQRKFTPVSRHDSVDSRFTLVIKIYSPSAGYPDGGKMSQFLDKLPLGERVMVRGKPTGEHEYIGGDRFQDGERVVRPTHICMIAGGSGITPMYQIGLAMLRDMMSQSSISLLYANSTEEDVLLKPHFDEWARMNWRFRIWYTVSNPTAWWKYSKGRITQQMMEEKLLPSPRYRSETLCIVCGPNGFVDSVSDMLQKSGISQDMIWVM